MYGGGDKVRSGEKCRRNKEVSERRDELINSKLFLRGWSDIRWM
jgi:hypothetical protein